MRAWIIGLGFVVPSSMAVASCALGDFTKVEAPPVDAGTDGSGGCGHATVPLPPTADAGADPDAAPPMDETHVVALHVIRLIKGPNNEDQGLDLDRFCSCQGETPSCTPPKDQDPTLACDGAQGRDNQMPVLFNALKFAFQIPDLSQLYSQFAHTGGWSILLRVSGYNGQPNDPSVRVDWYASGGDPVNMTTPLWNGDDIWPVTDDSVANNDLNQPLYYDAFGYVVDNKLVFSLPGGEIKIAGGQSRFSLRMTTGTILADIQKDAAGRMLLRNGLIAGRVALPDLFKLLSGFRTDKGESICSDNALYPLAKVAFCTGLDIQTGPAEPAKPCNAVSLAIGFDSDPAQLGAPVPPEPVPGGCTPEADPINDFADAGCSSVVTP